MNNISPTTDIALPTTEQVYANFNRIFDKSTDFLKAPYPPSHTNPVICKEYSTL